MDIGAEGTIGRNEGGAGRRPDLLGVLKRFAPEIAVGVVTGVISNIVTGGIMQLARRGRKKKKK